MPTFLPGSGALGLKADINSLATTNGCEFNTSGNNISLWEEWNTSYAFSPEFNAPFNMGFFYGAGCPATIILYTFFSADPYSDNFSSWGVYYKVGTTGTETLIDNMGTNRANYDDCVQMDTLVNTKGGLGQSGNTVYIGVRATSKAATPAYYDADLLGLGTCILDIGSVYGGTYDYPGSCPGQFSAFIESADILEVNLAVSVNKSGYVETC